jgi:site-specific recombinase XerD
MNENALTIAPAELSAVQSLPADQNPALVYLASLSSANSRSAMRNALNLVADILTHDQLDKSNSDRFLAVPWEALRFQHTQAIRAGLSERVKYTTANLSLSALRGVLNTAADLGLLSADDCRAACKIKAIKGQSAPAGRDLAMGEILALVQACKADPSPAGARDAAMFGVLYVGGLRRSEIVGLDLADYSAQDGKLSIRAGKGNKDRVVYITNGAKKVLDSWIARRGSEPGALFCRIRQGGQVTGARLTAHSVDFICKTRGAEAGVKDFSPHDLRRTFVGDLLDRGADIATVAKLAGHASVTTTARYDRRNEEVKRKAAGLLHFPE